MVNILFLALWTYFRTLASDVALMFHFSKDYRDVKVNVTAVTRPSLSVLCDICVPVCSDSTAAFEWWCVWWTETVGHTLSVSVCQGYTGVTNTKKHITPVLVQWVRHLSSAGQEKDGSLRDTLSALPSRSFISSRCLLKVEKNIK